MLDVHRLRLLRELSQRGTITAVAQALDYSASAVSQHLAQLEREARTPLLERVGRRVRLTAAAEVLVLHAEAVLARLEEAEADLAAAAAGTSGVLRLAMFHSAAHALLTSTVQRLRTTAPALTLRVQVLDAEIALPRLTAHEVDLVVTEEYPDLPLPRSTDLHRDLLLDDPLKLAVPAAAPPGRALADHAHQVWVLEPPGTAARAWAEAVCRTAGFEPDVLYESTDLQLHARLARAGAAAAFLPALAAGATPAGIRLDHLPGSPARRLSTVVRRGAVNHPHVVSVREALGRSAAHATH